MKFLPKNSTNMYKLWIKTSFVPKNVHLVLKNKKIVLFTLKIKFLQNNFTKMYKFWIKTVVLYPKIYIWSRKPKKIVLFTLKMKFLLKNFTKMYKIFFITFLIFCSRGLVEISNISRNYQNYSFFYFFAFFMKIVGFRTVFIADMNSAWKNIPRSIFL